MTETLWREYLYHQNAKTNPKSNFSELKTNPLLNDNNVEMATNWIKEIKQKVFVN